MIRIEAPNLKAKLQNDTVRYYVEEDNHFIEANQGYVTITVGRVGMNEGTKELEKNPIQLPQYIGKSVKLNQFLDKFQVGDKKLLNGKEHILKAIDIHMSEDDSNKRVNTKKFVAELYFNLVDDNNDYRYI